MFYTICVSPFFKIRTEMMRYIVVELALAYRELDRGTTSNCRDIPHFYYYTIFEHSSGGVHGLRDGQVNQESARRSMATATSSLLETLFCYM